jgi:tRNA(fMet)-specific endonuclease VapC
MAETVERLSGIRILPFDEAAIEQFERLKAMRLGVGTMDLRIAAIALTTGATVVTRNARDFGRVPERVIADWSQGTPAP